MKHKVQRYLCKMIYIIFRISCEILTDFFENHSIIAANVTSFSAGEGRLSLFVRSFRRVARAARLRNRQKATPLRSC